MTILGSEGDSLDYLRAVDELDEPDRQHERYWQQRDRLSDHTPVSNVFSLADFRRRKLRSLPYPTPPRAA